MSAIRIASAAILMACAITSPVLGQVPPCKPAAAGAHAAAAATPVAPGGLIVGGIDQVLAPAAPATSGPSDTPPAPPGDLRYIVESKADGAQSPIPFPQVAGNAEWLGALLANEYTVLRRLYTTNALQALWQQEGTCNDPRTAAYCKIRLRLYWIDSAVQ